VTLEYVTILGLASRALRAEIMKKNDAMRMKDLPTDSWEFVQR